MRARYVVLAVAVCAALLGTIFITRIPSRPPSVSPLAPEITPETRATPLPVTRASVPIQPLAQKVTVTLTTSKGTIRLELDGTTAPLTVGNFVALAQQGFYNGTTFHRVIPDFMIQGGDPLSKDPSRRALHGTGGPGYTFPDEINGSVAASVSAGPSPDGRPRRDGKHIVRGSVAMANSGPNTNGSQFFIVTASATPHLDKKHTNFGQVVAGMDVVDAISRAERDENDNPLQPVMMDTVTVETSPAVPTTSPPPARE